jgi:hypothetical protein
MVFYMEWKKKFCRIVDTFNLPKGIRILERQNQFMLFELRCVNEVFRNHHLVGDKLAK